MPVVTRRLQEITGLSPTAGFAAEDAVARGAALHAECLLAAREKRPLPLRLTLIDVTARSLGLEGLDFVAGDIHGHPAEPVDLMIALHACDIATDVAMHRGAVCGASIIVCAPCCHKELRPQLHSPPVLEPLLRHGIHRSECAEMLTDALRALLLRRHGYDTQVFEFISPEHTGKNKMVLAVRRAQPLPASVHEQLARQVSELKAFFGVRSQYLETLFADAQATSASTAGVAATTPECTERACSQSISCCGDNGR